MKYFFQIFILPSILKNFAVKQAKFTPENPGVLVRKNPGVGVSKLGKNPGVSGSGLPRGGNPIFCTVFHKMVPISNMN